MIHKKGTNDVLLKEINKNIILKILIESGRNSRIDISRQLKISRPTISSYIGELIEDGLVKEIGKDDSTSSGGKKAILLQFNERAGYILGAMIGVKNIRVALTDLRSNIIEKIKIPTEEWLGPDAVIDKLVKNLEKVVRVSGVDKEKIIGIGIGTSGLVDSKKGLVIFSPNLTGWNNIKLKEVIEKKTKITTFIENECRVQAIAEKKHGLAKDAKNFVSFETGTGIGTGVFIDNKLVVGENGMAGEVGHIITNLGGNRICHCGNKGCLETLCSITSLTEGIMADIKKSERFSDYDMERLKTDDLCKLYEQGDKLVTRNVEKNAYYVGIGISNTIKMFNPEVVIIHGEVIKFGEKYLNKVIDAAVKSTFPKVKKNFNIKFSEMGENVGLIGAGTYVFDNVFDFNNFNATEQYIIKKGE